MVSYFICEGLFITLSLTSVIVCTKYNYMVYSQGSEHQQRLLMPLLCGVRLINIFSAKNAVICYTTREFEI